MKFQIIEPRLRDVGGMRLKRVLPAGKRRSVGPFVFWDHMGLIELAAGGGIDVPPHPHIGLATVTYLFEGEVVHRDSLGVEQTVRPGDVNWMTAGRGIVHSERTAPDVRAQASRLHGIQAWVALPVGEEDARPSFRHYPSAELPTASANGRTIRVLAGEFADMRSPVQTMSSLFCFDTMLEKGAKLELSAQLGERAVYLCDGEITVGGDNISKPKLAVTVGDEGVVIDAVSDSRFLAFGGPALKVPRHMWWNFVSSSKDKIERAKADWAAGRFDPIPSESEFMKMPES
jgi:redox-sensitive bicupin YhaK (pirin superfamily)